MNRFDRTSPTAEENEEQLVARLFAEAGPPPPAPELEIARIQEAARAEWRRRWAWRQRERVVSRWQLAAAAALIVAALALVFWPRGGSREPAAPATLLAAVERAAGDVTIVAREGGEARPLGVGDRVAAGSIVRTAAEDSLLALRWDDGRSLRLAAASELAIVTGERIELRAGAVYLDSRGAAVGTGPTVATPLGRFDELGTQFEVRLGPGEPASVRLRVREGAVEWRENGRSARAEAGVELALGADGSLVRDSVAPHGDEWAWVLAAAPPPAIEGWPLARFLAWYGRESGLEIEYADAGSAELAASVIVHGSVAELAPAEALDAVLASSGFRAQVNAGRLVVAALADDGG